MIVTRVSMIAVPEMIVMVIGEWLLFPILTFITFSGVMEWVGFFGIICGSEL